MPAQSNDARQEKTSKLTVKHAYLTAFRYRLSLFFSANVVSHNPNGARTASEHAPNLDEKLQRSNDSV